MAAASRIFLASRRTFTRFLRTDSRLVCQAAATVDSGTLKQTVLHDFHEAQGGKMVPFAGWSMPVQYGDLSIINSCLHTRQNASIFDVSHMLQMEVTGADAENFLEYILVADLANLKNGSASLSMFTTAVGGIIDDCIVTRTGENTFYIVSNAGRADADLHHMKSQLMQFKNGSANVTITPFDDKGLVALQGPKSASVLQQGVVGDLSQLKFMHSAVMDVFNIPQCRVSRCGYTGEDGFEISVPADKAVQLVETLLAREEGIVKLAGLGARDVLRLEAGLCLYGNDISEETTPIEAGLAWCISKRRRNEGGFLGADLILQQLKDKPARKRVGFVTESGPPVRQGCQVSGKTGDVIGTVTSGSPSPTLNINIAMAYVPRGLSKVNTELTVHIRKHMVNARVVKMPFVPSNYYN